MPDMRRSHDVTLRPLAGVESLPSAADKTISPAVCGRTAPTKRQTTAVDAYQATGFAWLNSQEFSLAQLDWLITGHSRRRPTHHSIERWRPRLREPAGRR
jgi:hypothetical protein